MSRSCASECDAVAAAAYDWSVVFVLRDASDLLQEEDREVCRVISGAPLKSCHLLDM